MFPYFKQPVLKIGPIALHAFGAVATMAFLLGVWMLVRGAEQNGMDGATASHLAMWMVIFGVLGAHLLAVVFSKPHCTAWPTYWPSRGLLVPKTRLHGLC